MTDPDMGTWTYQYDAAGRLITQTDALTGAFRPPLEFTYDGLGRLTQKRSGSTVLATYGYDDYNPALGQYGRGHRTQMTDTVGWTGWQYNPRGDVVSVTQRISRTATIAESFTTRFSVDALGRVLSTTYPTTEVVTNTYTPQGALTAVRSLTNGDPYVKTVEYNANGSPARLEYCNGLTQFYGYFGLTGTAWDVRPGFSLSNPHVNYGRLWRARLEGPGGGVPLQDWRYGYDAVGNVTALYDVRASSPRRWARS